MITPFSSGIRYTPYNWDLTQERAFSNCSGAGFSTMISGNPTAITLKFDTANMSTTVPSKIAYQIDGQGWTVVPVKSRVELLMPSQTALWATHELEVIISTTSEAVARWVSPYPSAVKFTGIDTVPENCVAARLPEKPMNGLVFGDSITEGINTIGRSGDATNRSDALHSWAYQLGSEIGAEIGVVGFGLLGISRAGNGGVPKFGDSWSLIASGIPRVLTPEPNFIAINLGTNDKNSNIAQATFISEYVSALNAILKATSITKIFVMMPFGGHYGALVYQEIVSKASDAKRVFFVNTTGWWASGDAGDGVHPWGYTAPKHAKLLAEEISNNLDLSLENGIEKVYDGFRWR